MNELCLFYVYVCFVLLKISNMNIQLKESSPINIKHMKLSRSRGKKKRHE